MSGRWFGRLAGVLRWILPREYFLIFGDSSAQLTEMVPGRPMRFFARADWSPGDIEARDEELASLLSSCRSYSGDPLTVLYASGRSYLYASLYHGELPRAVLENLKLFARDPEVLLHTASIHFPAGSLLLAQGVDRSYHQSTLDHLNRLGIRVKAVAHLGGHLIARHLRDLYVGETRLKAGDCSVRVYRTAEGQIDCVISDSSRPQTITQSIWPAESGIESSGTDMPASRTGTVAPTTSSTFSRVADLFRGLATHAPRSVYVSGSTCRHMILGAALNTLRALVLVLGTCAVVAAAITGGVIALTDSDSPSVQEYQTVYTQLAQTSSDNLRLLEATEQMTARQSDRQAPGAMLSLFCQKGFSGLRLRGITLNYTNDSMTVEASGIAYREAQVFDLLRFLNNEQTAITFSLSSLRPEQVTIAQRVDTLLGFKLTAVSHGNRPKA